MCQTPQDRMIRPAITTSWRSTSSAAVASSNPRVLAVITPGLADGFRVDRTDHIFTSAGDGIHVLSPRDGESGGSRSRR